MIMSTRHQLLQFFLPLFLALGELLLVAQTPWTLIALKGPTSPASDSSVVIAEDTFGEKSPWNITQNVHGSHPDKAKILALCSSVRKDGALLIRIESGVSAYKSRTGAVQMVTSGISRYLKLPANAAGKTLTTQLKSTAKGSTESFIIFQKNQKNIKTARGLSAVVPSDADTVVIIYRLNGPGELLLQHSVISLENIQADEDIICYAIDYLDRKFYLPEKGAIPIFFMIKREYGKSSGDVKLNLDLPEGVTVISAEKSIKPISSTSFNITTSFNATITRGGGFCCWRPILLMLQTDRKLNGETLRYHMTVNGLDCAQHDLELYTMPNTVSAVPEKFQSGIFMQWNGNLSETAAEEFMKNFCQAGFNILRVNFSPEFMAETRKNKVNTCNNWNYIRDGYPIFPEKNNPAPFLDIEGENVRGQLCPVEVYTRGAVYREHILPQIQKVLQQNTFFMINWEVYNSDYKGCFCSRCRDEFTQYSKLPEEDVKKVWPGKVVSTCHDAWVKFRSWQHGSICKVLEEDMSAVRNGTHFMPMLSISCFNEESTYCPQYHPNDFLQHLKWVNVWGPYLHTVGLNRPYEYQPGRYLQHYYAVENVMQYFKRHGGKEVNILGLPYGSHGVNANLPEAVALETLNNFILGYQGSLIYWFNFDYRYWSLMAQANAKIAACENMVNVWPAVENVKAVPVTPMLQPKHWKPHMGNCNYCPGLRKAETALITRAWSHGNSTLVAVGNFWEKGDVFFRLSIPSKTGDYVVRTPYPPYKYCKVSGEELAKGVLLHLKPLIWEFFLVEPWQNVKDRGAEFSTAKELAELKEDILQKIVEEDKLLSEMETLFKISDYSFDELPEITASSVKLKEKRLNGRQALSITTPVYQALLTPAESAQVRSLIVNGRETVFQGIAGSFGKPGFWRPKPVLVDAPFHIRSIMAEKDYVMVVLERPSTFGFDLSVTWKFYEKSLEESFTVRNSGKISENTILRFHHMPMHLANHTDSNFLIGTEKFEIIAKDRFFVQLPGVLGKQANIKGGDTFFHSPKMGFTLIHHPLMPIQGYYFWNNPGAETGTFEPVFAGTQLAAGKEMTISQVWEIEK